MKKLMLTLGLSLAGALGARAFDNTIDNDNWCTTAYVNATPVVATSVAACPLVAFKFLYPSSVLDVFDSFAPGALLLVR